MYICICSAVNDKTILQSISNGNHTLKAIKEDTNAMAQCCKCCVECKRILDDYLEQHIDIK